jgi:hypothetical protein
MTQHRSEIMRQLEAAIEKAPEQPEEVLQQHQSAHQTNGDRAEAFAGLPMLEIKAGNQTIQVLNDKAHLGNLQKSWKANRPYKVAREPLPPQNELISAYEATSDVGEREAIMQGMSGASLKKLGLDDEYVRYKGSVIRQEAVSALKSGEPGEVQTDIAASDEMGTGDEIRAAVAAAKAKRPDSGTPFERYAMQLNEITQLAQDLGKGRFPKILEIVKRNPDVRGVFRAEADNPKSGQVELKAGIFELLTEAEISEAKAEAFDILYETWLGESEASGNAGMSPPSKDVFAKLLETDKVLQGRLKLYETEVMDSTRREIAPEREPIQAGKTLAHEIGHWIDFLPDATMARGNILGRIASVHSYFKKMLPAKPGESELTGELLSNKERAKLTEYHKKPEELYADAFSVLVNTPHELEQRAPVFLQRI